MSLSGARRIVLVAYNAERGTIDFRHYLITVKPYGVSKRVRRVLEGAKKSTKTSTTGVLDLGNEKDIADFLLRKRGEPGPASEGGYESAASASSAAGDDGDAISLADDYVGRNNKKGQKKAVKLDEVGPRMELRLVKITEGVPGREGAVMYHEFGKYLLSGQWVAFPTTVSVKKTKAEASALKSSHAAKEKLRKQRRAEQEENVRRKKEAKEKGSKEEAPDEQMDVSGDEEDYEEDDPGWDEEEEISDVDDDDSVDSEQESEDEPEQPPPPKRAKVSVKR